MPDQIDNRKSQKIVLLVSVATIVWGLFELVNGNYSDFFKGGNSLGGSPSSRDMSQAVIFLVAVIMAFFSARTLLRGSRQQD